MPRGSIADQRDEPRGEVGRERRAAALVVDEPHRLALPRAVRRRASRCCARGSPRPTTPARSSRPRGHATLAVELRCAVDRARDWSRRPRRSRSAFVAVEDVVRRGVDEVRADPSRRRRRRSRCRSRSPRGRARARSRHGRRRCRPRGGRRRRVVPRRTPRRPPRRRRRRASPWRVRDDVELAGARPAARRAARSTRPPTGTLPCERVNEVGADLPGGAGHEDPHQPALPQSSSTTGARSRSGSHHARCSAYHADGLGDAVLERDRRRPAELGADLR